MLSMLLLLLLLLLLLFLVLPSASGDQVETKSVEPKANSVSGIAMVHVCFFGYWCSHCLSSTSGLSSCTCMLLCVDNRTVVKFHSCCQIPCCVPSKLIALHVVWAVPVPLYPPPPSTVTSLELYTCTWKFSTVIFLVHTIMWAFLYHILGEKTKVSLVRAEGTASKRSRKRVSFDGKVSVWTTIDMHKCTTIKTFSGFPMVLPIFAWVHRLYVRNSHFAT